MGAADPLTVIETLGIPVGLLALCLIAISTVFYKYLNRKDAEAREDKDVERQDSRDRENRLMAIVENNTTQLSKQTATMENISKSLDEQVKVMEILTRDLKNEISELKDDVKDIKDTVDKKSSNPPNNPIF